MHVRAFLLDLDHLCYLYKFNIIIIMCIDRHRLPTKFYKQLHLSTPTVIWESENENIFSEDWFTDVKKKIFKKRNKQTVKLLFCIVHALGSIFESKIRQQSTQKIMKSWVNSFPGKLNKYKMKRSEKKIMTG